VTGHNDDALIHYLRSLFAPEDDLLRAIRAEIDARGLPRITIQPEEAQVLQLLLKAIGARRVVEIGTMVGYSATWIARSLPPDGCLITIEHDPDRAEIALEFFKKAGVDGRIDLRIGPAFDVLASLAADAPYVAVFIDANKVDYPAYLTWAVDHIRVGGLILGHNALMGGAVAEPSRRSDRLVKGVLAFNQQIAGDPHLHGAIIPIGDGIAAALKIGP
jgi:caffeoyl-CoA O-methyltransferase